MYVVDTHVRARVDAFSPDQVAWIEKNLTRRNPAFDAAKRGGAERADIPEKYQAFERLGDELVFPRGAGTRVMRRFKGPVDDRTLVVSAEWPRHEKTPRDYQAAAVAAAVAGRNGLLILPTGSGKTFTVGVLARRLGVRTLVVCPAVELAKQWIGSLSRDFGLPAESIGRVFGGKASVGDVVTVALPHSLTAERRAEIRDEFGLVVLDECHHAAATMYLGAIESFPARWRIGVSADERRQDEMEHLTRAVFGRVLYRMGRAQGEEKRAIVPVVVRLVRTGWPSARQPHHNTADRERALMADASRLAVLDATVAEAARPTVVFCGLRETVDFLAERYGAGRLIGSAGKAATRREFQETKAALAAGGLAVATVDAFGEGQDVCEIASLVLATPLGRKERAFLRFNQIRGRGGRNAAGKTLAHVYVLWDDVGDPGAGGRFWRWNDGRVEVKDRGRWRPAVAADLTGGRVF